MHIKEIERICVEELKKLRPSKFDFHCSWKVGTSRATRSLCLIEMNDAKGRVLGQDKVPIWELNGFVLFVDVPYFEWQRRGDDFRHSLPTRVATALRDQIRLLQIEVDRQTKRR